MTWIKGLNNTMLAWVQILRKSIYLLKLVYYEEFQRIDEAFYREKQVQGWSRKKKEALISGAVNQLHQFDECRNETHFRNVPFDSAQGTVNGSADVPFDSAQGTAVVERSRNHAQNKTKEKTK